MGFWDDAEIISTYTRAQAIDDGTLVDVTEWAKETGFRYPVAMTRAVWCRYVEVPEGVECQDERGRAHDILWMLFRGIKRTVDTSKISYVLYVRNDNSKPKLVKLKAICGPGDDPRPVITIMLPDED